MALEAGAKLGPYEIVSALGAGGMGEVYKARDTRLDRTVAVKVASGNFSDRFEREARAVASLNHPHICTLHDVGPNYLVMEYLEGETLAARIDRGAIPFREAMELALQIADALVAAHGKGITHRDIKPGNVMLVRSGAKLLDFGLARMERPISGSDETVTMAAMTTPGTIVGTFQYMAPEQLEGKEADARSDIFSFGVLLYEMLTGRKAFQGKTQVSLMAAILEHQPEPASAVQPALPAEMDRFLSVCLAKNPDERFQSAKDIARELKWIAERRPAAAPKTATRPWTPNRWAYVAAASTLFAIAAVIAPVFVGKPPLPRIEFSVLPPEGTIFAGAVPRAAISPDGTQIAFHGSKGGRSDLWLRRLDSTQARVIPGTEGTETPPFWSPDGKFIGFFAGGKLRRVDLAGGTAQVLCDAPANNTGGSWSPDGSTIIFSGDNPATGIRRVFASGGAPSDVVTLSEGGRTPLWPRFLPDGKHFLYYGGPNSEPGGVWAGSLDGGEPKRLVTASAHAEFASGHLIYPLEGALMARPFDPAKLEFLGEPASMASTIATLPNGRAGFSVSENGNLVLAEGLVEGSTNRLVWLDRAGKELSVAGEPGTYGFLALSPDGRNLAMNQRFISSGSWDVWVMDLTRGVASRMTSFEGLDIGPVWSNDGLSLAFYSKRSPAGLYRIPASGLGKEELLIQSNSQLVPLDWSRDGKFLLLQQGNTGTWKLQVLPMDGGGELRSLQATKFNELRGRFSPDGRWIAYVSNESGTFEVYVRSFPGDERKVQISKRGGTQPQWRRDGRELYYATLEGRSCLYRSDPSLRSSLANQRRFLCCRSRRSSMGPATCRRRTDRDS